MLCPRCGGPLKESKKSQEYLLCDNCMKKIRVENVSPDHHNNEQKEQRLYSGLIVAAVILAVLIAILVIILIASLQQGSPSEQTNTVSESEISDLDTVGEVDVDSGIFDVNVTVPAEYAEGETQESLNADAEEYGYQAVLNDDGSVTYTMTKAQHSQMMESLAESINESMASIIGSEEYPNISGISANDDFTAFTVTTTSTDIGSSDGLAVMGLYMYSGLYHIFNGTSVDNIHVDYINADSGEIIGSADSSELGESAE